MDKNDHECPCEHTKATRVMFTKDIIRIDEEIIKNEGKATTMETQLRKETNAMSSRLPVWAVMLISVQMGAIGVLATLLAVFANS